MADIADPTDDYADNTQERSPSLPHPDMVKFKIYMQTGINF